ncbi:unnamed protein product [Meloidogyne enterolobii]|uniref:Uncharacterized protein n=1 Tax=Meloidogyne enterolobii TaxID=390850 RepID=A0ACB0Y7W0_MELEN
MVQLIEFGGVRGPLTLSEQAENIEIKVKNNNLKSTKYQISNKNNPEKKFSVFIDEVYRFDENIAIYNVKIERNM